MAKKTKDSQESLGKELDFSAFLQEIQKEDTQEVNELQDLEHAIDELQDSLRAPIASKQRTSGFDTDTESALLQQIEREFEDEEDAQEIANALQVLEPAATPAEQEAEEASYLAAVDKKKRDFKAIGVIGARVAREKRRKQKLLIIEIQRKALAQDALDLSELIPIETLQELIKALTIKFRYLCMRYEALITKHIESLMRKHIPLPLRAMYKAYPQAFITHPGFMYQASEEFGGGIKHWVTPKLPYVLPQFSEAAFLREHNEARCIVIDRLIKRLYRTRELLDKAELRIGTLLAHLMPNHTYYTLLVKHPFWFVTLYEKETGLSLGVYEKVAALQHAPNNRSLLKNIDGRV